MNNYRHGDISFHGISEKEAKEMTKIPWDKNAKKDLSSFVVALGESTGHKHVLTMEKPKSLAVIEMENGEAIMVLNAPGTITHEEHDPITLEPGFYVKKIEREYDPFKDMARRSLD